MGAYIDLTEQTFGRLTVIEEVSERTKSKKIRWKCVCICKNIIIVVGSHLKSGHTKSCGCLFKELAITNATKHGKSKTSEYFVRKTAERREKKKELDSQWTLEMQELLFQIHPYCTVCGTIDKLEIDHVKPLSKGFGLKPGNAIILCRSCNSTKHSKDLNELPTGMKQLIEIAARQFLLVWYARHFNIQETDKWPVQA